MEITGSIRQNTYLNEKTSHIIIFGIALTPKFPKNCSIEKATIGIYWRKDGSLWKCVEFSAI